MFQSIFFIFILVQSLESLTLFEKPKHVVRIDTFEGYCDGRENLFFGFKNITLQHEASRRTLINGIAIVKGDMGNQLKGEVEVSRCVNKESPDSCQNFKAMTFPNLCMIWNIKEQLWSTLTLAYQPKMTCPFQQGEYKLVNGYLDAEHPPFFVDSTWYWKIRLHIINSKTKEEYGCIYVEGKFFKMLN